MGQDMSLQLREQSLLTKIMLKEDEKIIQHIEGQKLEINRPINQMGDTILHYAAYKSLKQLIKYLLNRGANPYLLNNRSLTAVDIAIPEVREQIIRDYNFMIAQRDKLREDRNSKFLIEDSNLSKHKNT